MLLFRTRSAVKVGQLHRYIITYTPSLDNVVPIPDKLFLRVRNTEVLPLRAAYLNGPFILNVDVKPSHYDPYVTTENPNDFPAFDPQVKAAQSFYADLKLDNTRLSHSWTIDVVSQIIFSSSAKVSFEISVGRNQESLHMEAEEGIFSSSLKVSHYDTAAIWSSPRPDPDSDVHLVVVTHGLHSNTGADMLFMKEQIEKATETTGENLIVRGFFDNVCRTERGVKYLGKRVAIYIATVLREPNVKKISFVGHSLGGLTMTYAIAYIHAHYPDFFQKIEPINFIALATPLLGLSNENPLYVKFALDFGLVGKTGQDLGLTWKPSSPFSSSIASKPLLRILPTGPAAEILKRFKRRTVYANAVNDGIVPLRTSSLLYLDWKGLSKVERVQQGERVPSSSHDLKGMADNEGEDSTEGREVSEVQDAAVSGPDNQTGIIAQGLRPIQMAFSYFRPQAMKKRSSKIYRRSQTIDSSSDLGSGDLDSQDAVNPLPKTSVIESATSILNPSLPPPEFYTDVSTRPPAIFHDRIYRPEDIPHRRFKKSSTYSNSNSSKTDDSSSLNDGAYEKGRVEEKIARAWHDNMTWRKVLVQLEPDAHNNIIVRRTFANAYGWPVVRHLVDNHFINPYDPEAGCDREKADEGEVDVQQQEADQADIDYNVKMLNMIEAHDADANDNTDAIDYSFSESNTMDSARWGPEAFEVSEDDNDYDEDGERRSQYREANFQDIAHFAANSLSQPTQALTGIVSYLSEWSPAKLYGGYTVTDKAQKDHSS
ncbi:putative serine esterase-domain-containing protein [Dipodascopsis uninucleata]